MKKLDSVNLAYRFRWCYLALTILAALYWWGVYPGTTLANEAPYGWLPWEIDPVCYVLDIVSYFWTQKEYTFSSRDGMLPAWGGGELSTWNRYNPGAWNAAGIPWMIPAIATLMGGLIFAGWWFMREGVRGDQAMPATQPIGRGALLSAGCIAGLLLAGLAVFVLDLRGWMQPWIDAAIYDRQSGKPSRPEIHPALMLLPATGLSTALLSWMVQRSDQYWQRERITLLMIVGAGLLLLIPPFLYPPNRSWWWHDSIFSVTHTVAFSATTVLVWALAVRTWLLFRLRRYERARKDTTGCFACGYDLRGSLAAGAHSCPECGLSVSPEVVIAFEVRRSAGAVEGVKSPENH